MDETALVRQFRAYLHASERLMTVHSLLDKLDVVAQGVVESGLFQRCVVRVYRRRFSSRRVLGAAGLTPAERRILMDGPEASPERYLSLTEGARHLGGDCFYVRGAEAQGDGAFATVPSRREAQTFRTWHPEDSFLAHLYSSRRVLLGHLVADDPPDGEVPDEESCRSFVLFASLAARLLEQELRLRTDPMTDAFNGLYLDRELERLGASGRPFTAVFADMDGLKEVNDNCGHRMGDEYIRAAHDILLRHLPEDGLLYRPYGDEFVYLREDDDPAPVADAVARIPQAVAIWNEEVRPRLVAVAGSQECRGPLPLLDMSVGMAHGVRADADALVRRAEEAMFAEKGLHRARRSPIS
ncbi:MAG: GGDEF domain-containing protein [Firmicutes bacterium]|nr:GGDEF domain-containing protein [Bacillota bacterium]